MMLLLTICLLIAAGIHRMYLRNGWLHYILYFIFYIFIFSVLPSHAQTIGGNVYGGGNSGNVGGNTTVTVKGGDLQKVFGGARMANVGGRAYVNIDGEDANGDIFITNVFGGNDITGQIGSSTVPLKTVAYPTGLTDVLTGEETKETNPEKNAIDDSWNAYVRTSRSSETINDEGKETVTEKHTIVIGSLFGGGNGDYDYDYADNTPEEGKTTHYIYKKGDHSAAVATKVTDTGDAGFNTPELAKTYLELKGGCIAHVYGGGNNATVTENTTICVNNESEDLQTLTARYATANSQDIEDAFTFLKDKVQLNIFQSDLTSYAFNFARIFGGNNKADMAIRPTWNIQQGIIRDLYSGGNEGRMTSPTGLLLEIDPTPANKDKLYVYNVYGGCRRADVRPLHSSGDDVSVGNLPGYHFPTGMPARLLVRGGHITNVYGGNDISGSVYGGNAVGIYTTVYGNVYGGGNGSYAYTDNPDFKDNSTYADFYYDKGGNSMAALNAFRPNAEQVSIRLAGTEEKPTIIHGSVFCGGNSASLSDRLSNPRVELKIGSYVIADKVFLGNNGEKMVDQDVLSLYANNTVADYSSLDLTNSGQFADYMEGVMMPRIPGIVFDNTANGDPATFKSYTTSIGSFFCGGNVGGMAVEGTNTYRFDRGLIIYNKIVGGCNDANVVEQAGLNAAYSGGVMGTKAERSDFSEDGKIRDRLVLNLDSIRIEPKRWADAYSAVPAGTRLSAGGIYYTSATGEGEFTALGTEISLGSNFYQLDETASTELTWNTVKYEFDDEGNPTFERVDYDDESWCTEDPANIALNSTLNRRLYGGNIYGGCYNSGHVNGNIIINVNNSLLNRYEVFDRVSDDDPGDIVFSDHPGYTLADITKKNSGVLLAEQAWDEKGAAMLLFGGGFGAQSEVWGSTTINMRKGYTFQAFGGSEKGIIGKSREDSGEAVQGTDYEFNGKHYAYDPNFSTTVNMHGTTTGKSRTEDPSADIVDCEFIYGGGMQGPVAGDTHVYLGNGRLYSSFGGGCQADVLGHTETYVGKGWETPVATGIPVLVDAFPYLRDYVYGGTDVSGQIKGLFDASPRILQSSQVYRAGDPSSTLLKGNTYVEYLQGSLTGIFGGNYGDYDYDVDYPGVEMSYIHSSVVNIRPNANQPNSSMLHVFGGSQGSSGYRKGDQSQDHSYVHIDIPSSMDNFTEMDVFGGGYSNGLGMRYTKDETYDPDFDLDEASAVIDLVSGHISAAYGGSYNEGVTRRTVVNVPAESAINIGNIFGGAYGLQILPPCDVYESNVNYMNTSENARVSGAIYGGNNNERRTIYTNVNISSPVWQDKTAGYLATVYGAGRGIDTWTEHTLVNLLSGAKVKEAYGGGEMGHVLNVESVQQYMKLYKDHPSPQISADDPKWSNPERWSGSVGASELKTGKLNEDDEKTIPEEWAEDWADAWTFGETYFTPNEAFDNYIDNEATNLSNIPARPEIDADIAEQLDGKTKFNANVIINEGATVERYAYGGGWGQKAVALSGDIYGTTYIALLGGEVKADIYASGTSGGVYDLFGAKNFTASANAFIRGGTVRNVYGGGWEGHVGYHVGEISASTDGDILGETHVVIGRDQDAIIADSLALAAAGTTKHSFYYGHPTVTRNAYGGGEGGAVYGKTYLTLNGGYVGYEFHPELSDNIATSFDERYTEKIEDDTYTDKETGAFVPNTRLSDSGCLFGGGYVDNSYVDKTAVTLYGGHVRNSIFGGGEVAAIGRGDTKLVNGKYVLNNIYRPGKTDIEMYGGNVYRNVYGGGRGYNNLGEHGKLNCDGYVFGQTEVHIHGGEIGTLEGLSRGYGNVFGGGDVGYVYSAYENADGTFGKGVKSGVRYDGLYQGYYFKHVWENSNDAESQFLHENGTERIFTEECKVLVAPHCKATTATGTFTGIHYAKGERVTSVDYDYIKENATSLLPDINDNRVVTDNDGITFSRSYPAGAYVPIEALNTLKDKNSDAAQWGTLDPTGIIIHNAVFAGGNTSKGSSGTSANTTTVYGNATASIHDAYHRDLITLGTRHIGGLYGDGNLTLVDGYRELNITNYGTDYYSIKDEIGIDDYHALPEREAAYYELIFKCKKECVDKEGTVYHPKDPENTNSKASTITADDFLTLFDGIKDNGTDLIVTNEKGEMVPNSDYWEENGVLPVYAGRLMNSIQRADFCGVWGSRMVMQGAQDRVPEEVDYTNYTINRVREVSLNKKLSTIADDAGTSRAMHGNYFGIYNIVNYLGALTSDFDFGGDNGGGDVRTTDNSDEARYKADADGVAYNTATFYDWKKAYWKDRRRNNGNSHNKVALASGVYLELTTEQSTGDGLYEKDWGPITGVIELDLINVSQGIGGGFVYAKNQHGVRSASGLKNTTLTALNNDAVTQWDYTYTTSDASKHEWQTSGNFVHSSQVIIDDCYNISGKYKTEYKAPDGVPAHYWYIKGSVYVYDQYISAYTGIPNAYSETVEIPLTITAASHGTMKLLDVQTNRYAYLASPNVPLGDDNKVVINDKAYYKNDPISYWDYYLLSRSEKALFADETYVNCMTYYDESGTKHEAGTHVMTADDFETYKRSTHTYNDEEGNTILDGEKNPATVTYIFRKSNSVSHDRGYILTYNVNNPSIWDTWYTPKTGSTSDKITEASFDGLDAPTKATYDDGPTYRLSGESELLGQSIYEVGDIISQTTYYSYEGYDANGNGSYTDEGDVVGLKTNLPGGYTLSGQAEFSPAYLITEQVSISEDGETHHLNPGVLVSATAATGAAYSGKTTPAYICTHTIQLSKTDYIYIDTRMTADDKADYIDAVDTDIRTILPAGTISNARLAQIKTIDDLTPAERTALALTSDQEKKLVQLLTLKSDIDESIVPAYYCTTEGKYGGNYYVAGKNYRALEAWSSMSAEDRKKFEFNYDALDLLIDSLYSYRPNSEGTMVKYYADGQKYQYDSAAGTLSAAQANAAGYSLEQKIDYTATYDGSSSMDLGEGNEISVKRNGSMQTVQVVQKNDELSRDVFEALANEQRHYTAISVKEGGTYYVVNSTFQVGNTLYSVGELIDSQTYISLSDKTNITALTFSTTDENKNFYYCRENYKQGESVTPISASAVDGAAGGIDDDNNVLVGTLISSTDYDNLPNDQKNFIINGIAPTETSTLYVSRNSDIYDLSKEKIITVIYQYDYEESDVNGNITPVSERHVVNIHLQFKSGVPTVEDITKPEIILPGDYVSLREPNVTPGAYEITGGGWELFERPGDADSHINGIEYNPTFDPLYWYQHDWYVAYYAKTYLGRTYSNAVPVSVANYHDLAAVMSEANKEHHMYIDNEGVLRDPKIYINDYSASGENGLDELKRLFDLSVLTGYTTDHETGLITSGDFAGHKPLDVQVKGGANLEFFLRTDIDRPCSDTDHWTPIGDASQCFEGTLHGDGHTISGLDNSLFGELCGSVYNLGVTGSFTSAGVADTGNGYVESCWVKTTAESTTADPKPYAIFGDPTAATGYQVVNSYFCDSNKDLYNTSTSDGITTSGTATHGLATAMSERAFYNGTVAYDLNNFYLYKRYSDKKAEAGEDKAKYRYFTIGSDNRPVLQEFKYYDSNPALCSSGYNGIKYVEERFADGDFRYAEGTIPATANERTSIETVTLNEVTTQETHFYPIWPDDYIFFGQKLTYGYSDTYAHDEVPTAVVRSDGRLSLNADANRVYRAPAYYRSSALDVAHFNPHAYLAQTKNGDASIKAYPNMTAIDFAGHSDLAWQPGLVPGGLPAGGDAFYPPLLDDGGLLGIRNVDETRNLLAYAPAETAETGYANKRTYDVLTGYFTDPAFSDYYLESDPYQRVGKNNESVYGHLVKNDLTATNDHLLIDKQDFNAPFSYHFGSGKRMWYQRQPDSYVDLTKGWEGISIPFTAALVTTNDKGEITHFYDGSETSKNGTASKVAHEYWLRNYKGVISTSVDIVTANLSYPSAADGSPVVNKTVSNTFLWDYYYEAVTGHNHKDRNLDTYQTYYEDARTYTSYPLLGAAQPYIIGFPGNTYYEFDLSGNFVATTTATPNPARLSQQTITFASEPGIAIGVSDGEMGGKKADGYIFKPSYMNEELPTGYFVLNSDGNSYTQLSDNAATNTTNKVTNRLSAFRPYFTTASAGVKGKARSIVFSSESIDMGKGIEQVLDNPGTLIIRAQRRKIVVTSTLRKETTVNIVNAAGSLINTFAIQPGETVETDINNPGIYLVNDKKLSIR